MTAVVRAPTSNFKLPNQPGGRLGLPSGSSFYHTMNDDPQLRELLKESLPDIHAPGRFGAEVWQRIQARSEAPAKHGWARLFEPLFALLMRPAFAAVALLLAAGGGVAVASMRAADANEQARTALAERHVATLDPYARLMAMR